jgi:NADH:ubiquinone oxidoreductase subunit K
MIPMNPTMILCFVVIVAAFEFALGLGLGYIHGLSDTEKLREEIKRLKGNT